MKISEFFRCLKKEVNNLHPVEKIINTTHKKEELKVKS